ncbi:hypothetical protein G6O69_19355 [Pseudenhygromyxa sp. WMMC2535]|uniref:hypothetical protein n=1 Tax=Pseudenhygromyxa sp. WMMC2535 TaxID=2712867 RepID=UPI0015531EF8|nr:hypothetical protein [Pseudenhygromyxa sp. WMMC2535]NVB40011.1 hypothetical protein [Pseudenhygromyxa sp. WMMC2535]
MTDHGHAPARQLLPGAGLLLGLGLSISGCFLESGGAPAFRYDCSQTSECGDGEVCADGLCQQPCGGEQDEDCSTDAPVCFNGYCASICPIGDDVCSAPQECIAVDEDSESGICGVLCESDESCAEGETCVSGVCISGGG